ncbi:MAG: LLM class flavin-dependent oxidoreductase [Pseudomonadota bacterium]
MTDKALERTIRCADGWLPIGVDPEKLAPRIARLKEMADAAGRPTPAILTIGSLPEDNAVAIEQLNACKELGVEHYIQSSRYETFAEFEQVMARLREVKNAVDNS